jgi:microcystin-dependent protein
MSDQFLAEIRIFPFNFPPKGWAFCNGQLMPISQNTALFSLLGTTYGGNGTSNFALPNLQGSAPLGFGQGPGLTLRDLGEIGGEQTVTLISTEMPAHSHTAKASTSGGQDSPTNNSWGESKLGKTPLDVYAANHPNTNVPMSSQALSIAGGSLPHNNMPPFLCMNFVIALQGLFPSRS